MRKPEPADLPWIAWTAGIPDAELWFLDVDLLEEMLAYTEALKQRGELEWHMDDNNKTLCVIDELVFAVNSGWTGEWPDVSGGWLDVARAWHVVDADDRKMSPEVPPTINDSLLEDGYRIMRNSDRPCERDKVNDMLARSLACCCMVNDVVRFGLSSKGLRRVGGEAILQPVKRAHGPQEVAVIQLRQALPPDAYGRQETQEDYHDPRSYRYVVPAYLRRKSLPDGPLIQVREHVNGPKGKPLAVRPRVWSVTR